MVIVAMYLISMQARHKCEAFESIPGEIAHFGVLHANHAIGAAGVTSLGVLGSFHFVGRKIVENQDKRRTKIWRKRIRT